jgi:hypothetical protein
MNQSSRKHQRVNIGAFDRFSICSLLIPRCLDADQLRYTLRETPQFIHLLAIPYSRRGEYLAELRCWSSSLRDNAGTLSPSTRLRNLPKRRKFRLLYQWNADKIDRSGCFRPDYQIASP